MIPAKNVPFHGFGHSKAEECSADVHGTSGSQSDHEIAGVGRKNPWSLSAKTAKFDDAPAHHSIRHPLRSRPCVTILRLCSDGSEFQRSQSELSQQYSRVRKGTDTGGTLFHTLTRFWYEVLQSGQS
ncbi:hypothetical protein BAUCODRAFT_30860 [Baudoinia panamericana UAMH 10762]|uniref:Uncharacterized protein n=1 Tax=Baudoinia panamericana (strain UAMH 10762) TaxID=717646 RepID=M2LVE1_BAUPA|nr:uncharacterized protein BAUCODRAFT_30860 [Baudoinia panamericana UAMH 10762]EMC98592.1 hypothetical protein BAUCODRAFT_30860 [Baudoinia panamericana UAMH 10762]